MPTPVAGVSKLDPHKDEQVPPYVPKDDEKFALNQVMKDYIDGKIVIQRSYNQFNGRTLYEAIDDWTKRWNGYIPPMSPLLDRDQSRIFLNFTRNCIISYLAKVALQRPKAKVKAVHKRRGTPNQKFAETLADLNEYSLNEENGDARFLDAALECVVKGTVIVYEGYKKEMQKMKTIKSFDASTGKIIYGKEEERVIFDGCYQHVVPLEDFYIANAYEPDIQKQPFVLWRQTTTKSEAEGLFKKYANWKFVKAGAYTIAGDPTTFYRNKLITDLTKDQVEILRYYNRKKGLHVIVVNGVVMYHGPIPFKDGLYPFAKAIFEPFEVAFFWGAGFPQKVMGEQDLQNTFINMAADKQFGSLLPYGLSSDLDDLIEDDVLQPNKIRKVNNINNWKFDNLPGVTSGEIEMIQLVLNLGRENSGDITGMIGVGQQAGRGKITARQAMLKQQEAMQRLGFSMNFLEDFEVDRTKLRVHHILQFYSTPRLEKITGEDGKTLEKLMFRDVRIDNVKLGNGQQGTRMIKMVTPDDVATPDDKAMLEDQLSVTEAQGDITGQPIEALALNIGTFYDFNLEIQIVKNSSFGQNQVLDQAKRHEYAQWRLGMLQFGIGVDAHELISWVDESYDIDTDRFEEKQGQPGSVQTAQQAAAGGGRVQGDGAQSPGALQAPQKSGGAKPAAKMGASRTSLLDQNF